MSHYDRCKSDGRNAACRWHGSYHEPPKRDEAALEARRREFLASAQEARYQPMNEADGKTAAARWRASTADGKAAAARWHR